MTYLSPHVEGGEAERLPPWGLEPGRLWSLWDMLKESAEAFIEMGEAIADAQIMFLDDDNFKPWDGYGDKALSDKGTREVHAELSRLLHLAKRLNLPTSMQILGRRIGYESGYPRTRQEFDLIVEIIKVELSTKLFLFVPSHRAQYYARTLPNVIPAWFPSAAAEITEACNAYAFGLNTACVFHSMRAAEIGVRCLGESLGVTFPFDIILAEWHNILDQVDGKIRDKKNLKKGEEKDEELRFLSEAASQFRYFKDGWRIRVAHARATFNEQQARDVLEHVISFFGTISGRLNERGL